MLPENRFFPRDLSWLSFNYRVLLEAKDASLPLYERIKFLAIYSSNLEEFFKVRVASLLSVKTLGKKEDESGSAASQLLEGIYEEVKRQQQEFGHIFEEMVLPHLRQKGIHLLMHPPEHSTHVEYVERYFDEEIQAYLHPELLRKKKISHFLREGDLYLVVQLRNRPRKWEQMLPEERKLYAAKKPNSRYALVQVPTHYFSRFIELPSLEGERYYLMLDDIIRYNLKRVFHGFEVLAIHSIKLNRSAELSLEEELEGDALAEHLQASLKQRKIGIPARFLYDETMPKSMLKYLRDTFGIRKRELMSGGRYHNFHDFFQFPNPLAPELERSPTPPLRDSELESFPNLFEAIRVKNRLLHFPYQSYDYVVRFFNQAAADPQVTHIFATQYRVASGSAIVGALIRAARSGKQVQVFVEIKARFDEAANLRFAKEMEAAGVKIRYSFAGLKVHAKIGLVRRQETDQEAWYAFLSTGNFNEKTARIYADHGFFTADSQITSELHHVFRALFEPRYQPPHFQKLLVAQYNMRPAFETLIQQEIAAAQAGKPAHILIKLNNLEDKPMIDWLYRASQAGVRIRLLIRGICCLRPGVPGLSDHIQVVRIVDQFLEHARVFVFHQGGEKSIYLASSDWMSRNLNRRIEVGFPILQADLKAQLLDILHWQWADTVKGVYLDAHMQNVPRSPKTPPIRSQLEIYRRIKEGRLGGSNFNSKNQPETLPN